MFIRHYDTGGWLLNSTKSEQIVKLAGLFGVVGPIIALISISLAILHAPWFNWKINALSDLGVSGVSAIFFNSGLIIGGIFTSIFGLGLKEILPNGVLSRIGRVILVLDSITLCTIGIFPETAGRIHFYVSVVFFVLLPISLLLIGTDFMRERTKRKKGMLMITSGLFTVFIWSFPWKGAAIPEILAALTISLWSITLGFKLFRHENS